MNLDELRDALDGLFAYDMGATDSGIKDNQLKERCKAELQKLTPEAFTLMAREMWLSDEAMAQGYGVADLKEFIDWLADEMGYDL